MYLDFTAEQQALRKEIRDYYRELLTPELRSALEEDETGGPVYREVVGRMGADGWLGIGWPVEYGGQGRTPIEQFIFWDETYRARAPLPMISVNTVGPTLMQFGTEEQKTELLPRILRGELFFGIGYTEPEAGTDLASLQTRAVRDGDEYVINGQKLFTTHAHDADYIWLAARTDPDARKHKGISIILVPTDTPGFSWTPIYTLGGERTNATYYENVRVPVSKRVGPENAGWGLITSQLNHERITLACPGFADHLLEEVWEWALRTPAPGGGCVMDQEWVRIQPRARLRQARRAQAAELALGLVDHGRHSEDGRGVGGQGDGNGVLRRVLQAAARDRRVRRAGGEGAAGRALRGPARAGLSRGRHAHLRRRRQRGAARHHRHRGAGSAPGATLARQNHD